MWHIHLFNCNQMFQGTIRYLQLIKASLYIRNLIQSSQERNFRYTYRLNTYTRRQGIFRCEYIKLTMLHITKAGLTINLKLKRAKPRQANTQVSGTKRHSLPGYRNPTWNLILMHNGQHEKGDYMYMYKLHTPSFIELFSKGE